MVGISVIIPVYNEEKYIRQCLDSVCGQTFSNVEIICVDDGSTDDSLAILKEYAKKDPRLRVLIQQNQFAGTARNEGMKYASGEYLLFLDGDDFFAPDMFEKMYNRAKEADLEVVICEYQEWNERRRKLQICDFSIQESYLPEQTCFSGEELKNASIFRITEGWTWDKLWKRTFVEQCGYQFPGFRSAEDGSFVFLLMARARRMGFLKERLVVHRVADEKSLSNTKEQDWINGFKMLELIWKELNSLQLYERYEASFQNFVLRYQAWHIESMHTLEAYKHCFLYIKEEMERRYHILELPEEFVEQPKLFSWYQKLLHMSFEEFLFAQLAKKQELQEKVSQMGWVVPYAKLEKGKKIVLYGAGTIGKAYYQQLTETNYCEKILWVDKNYAACRENGYQVESPNCVEQEPFDYVVVAILQQDTQEKVVSWLESKGIKAAQIVCVGE